MKRRLQQALLVEGKYDAARLANLVEGIILTTDGFAVFKDRAMQDLLKRTARACGLVPSMNSPSAAACAAAGPGACVAMASFIFWSSRSGCMGLAM